MSSAYHLLRTILYLIPMISVHTVVFGGSSLVCTLILRNARWGYRCAQLWGYMILVTTGVRVEVRGREHLVAGATYVFVANHQSIYDIPVLFWHVPHQLRIIAKSQLGWFPFLGWYLRCGGNLLVDRAHPDRAKILNAWRTLLQQGLSLIVFAEGTRSADGRVAKFRVGSFLQALQTGTPIVPLSISGTLAVMRKGHLTTRPGDVVLTIHPPVVTDTGEWKTETADARRLAEHVRRMVMSAVDVAEPASRP
jgi:1-acyl-sn-glycerol-3-phosphate acyltransferase